MNHEHAPAAYPHGTVVAATTAGPFSAAEIDSLHKQDIAAGRAVVVLMCTIFLLGVFIYSIVAFTVAF